MFNYSKIYTLAVALATLAVCHAANTSGRSVEPSTKMGVEIWTIVESGNEYAITYQFGLEKSDTLYCQAEDKNSYDHERDIELNLRCPEEGNGKEIVYAEVEIRQSSTLGEGKIIDGGIGREWIKLFITAKNTVKFDYNARIYSRN